MILVKWLSGDLETFPDLSPFETILATIQNRYPTFWKVSLIPSENEAFDYLVIITKQFQLPDSDATKIYQQFRKKFEKCRVHHKFERWLCMLKESSAIVAGGAVVSVFGNFEINDFDIYVPFTKAFKLILSCMNLGFRINHLNEFYYPNTSQRILLRAQMSLPADEILLDILVHADDVDHVSLVSGFDLSFCQTWWDGEHVFTCDPDGLKSRQGSLNVDYRARLYRDFDVNLIKRIHKYRKRGFSIDTFDDSSQTIESLSTGSCTHDLSGEEWAVYKFSDEVVNYFLQVGRQDDDVSVHLQELSIFFRIWPQYFTLHHLRERWHTISDRLLELTIKKTFEEESIVWEHFSESQVKDFQEVFCKCVDFSVPLSPDDRLEWEDSWNEFWRETVEPFL